MRNDLKNLLRILVPSLLTFIGLYLLLYVWSDLGYSNFCLNIAPMWFESIVTLLVVPFMVGIGIGDKVYGWLS